MGGHLWEVKHPYYCEDQNYHANGTHQTFRSWAEFVSDEGDADLDMNLLFRFDWKGEHSEEDEIVGYTGDDNYRYARLHVYFMGQRKGAFRSAEVDVCRADEPAILEYLKPRFEHMMRLWEPLSRQENPHG